MNNCVFCKFAKNKNLIPNQFISGSGDSFTMLSLNPQIKGHTLVIPKKHFSKLSDVQEPLQGKLFSESVKVGEKLKKLLGAKAYTIKVNNELYKLESNGHIGHIHFHIIPRYKAGERLLEEPKRAVDKSLKLVRLQLTGTSKNGK